jgi:hypothetical protein
MSMHRRTFVLSGLTARASARIAGANDRLRIGIVGPGAHGSGLLRGFHGHHKDLNAELAAVCDLWSKRRATPPRGSRSWAANDRSSISATPICWP